MDHHRDSQADDDDLDDLSFGGPATASQPLKPPKPTTGTAGGSGRTSPNPLSGRIGSTPSGGTRENWGGVRTETRFTGESTLDEPISKTIVSVRSKIPGQKNVVDMMKEADRE